MEPSMAVSSTAHAPLPASPRKDSPENIADTARQFEGLLIAQMLKSARESSSSGFGTDDHASDSVVEMAEQQLSSVLSSGGGLGLSRLIVQGLSKPARTAESIAPQSPVAHS